MSRIITQPTNSQTASKPASDDKTSSRNKSFTFPETHGPKFRSHYQLIVRKALLTKSARKKCKAKSVNPFLVITVAFVLMDHSNDYGKTVFCSREKMAGLLELSVPSIDRALAVLKNLGFIERVQKCYKKDGEWVRGVSRTRFNCPPEFDHFADEKRRNAAAKGGRNKAHAIARKRINPKKQGEERTRPQPEIFVSDSLNYASSSVHKKGLKSARDLLALKSQAALAPD